jgi:hypothetical protein
MIPQSFSDKEELHDVPMMMKKIMIMEDSKIIVSKREETN